MELTLFHAIVERLRELGHADSDIEWAENAKAPASAEEFATEAIFVICNSGMKHTVARRIFERCMQAVQQGLRAGSVFGHEGKAAAIDRLWSQRERYFDRYLAAPDKLTELASLPWIGSITKYHLAKNFGVDVAKPDVHLKRLAARYDTTPQALCEQLAKDTGFRIGTVDVLLWRAAATGVIDARTGTLRPPRTAAIT